MENDRVRIPYAFMGSASFAHVPSVVERGDRWLLPGAGSGQCSAANISPGRDPGRDSSSSGTGNPRSGACAGRSHSSSRSGIRRSGACAGRRNTRCDTCSSRGGTAGRFPVEHTGRGTGHPAAGSGRGGAACCKGEKESRRKRLVTTRRDDSRVQSGYELHDARSPRHRQTDWAQR